MITLENYKEILGDLDNADWLRISKYQKLSESFIEKFQDKVDWSGISMCQVLSGDFIEKFTNNVNWYCVPEYQNHPKSDYHVVHYCGDENRVIRISKDNLSIIEIGCFGLCILIICSTVIETQVI